MQQSNRKTLRILRTQLQPAGKEILSTKKLDAALTLQTQREVLEAKLRWNWRFKYDQTLELKYATDLNYGTDMKVCI